jgi:hypothetical protein
MGIYNAQISAGSLMLQESRRVAKLLATAPTNVEWLRAIKDENILQKNTPSTALRQASLIRNRLLTLNAEAWELIAESEQEVATQLLLAATIKHSRLLGDFMQDIYAQQLRILEHTLSYKLWDGFITECINRDEKVAEWTSSTKKKLYEVIIRILTEAKYLDSSKCLNMTPAMLHPKVVAYLKRNNETQVLSTMEHSK